MFSTMFKMLNMSEFSKFLLSYRVFRIHACIPYHLQEREQYEFDQKHHVKLKLLITQM